MFFQSLPQMVYLHRDPVDFRKQINGLSIIVEAEMHLNPFDNALFVFTNRGRNSVRILYWDRNGFCLWQKRLEQDHFAWPRSDDFAASIQLSAQQLRWLLEGFDPWSRYAHKPLKFLAVS